mmetsp:Transcript_3200/g.6667  ORF Transcript_3200/g.6667 Transcript_3200/m.6667 type:complete len:225 (-) Transcript_3200:8-682(-)
MHGRSASGCHVSLNHHHGYTEPDTYGRPAPDTVERAHSSSCAFFAVSPIFLDFNGTAAVAVDAQRHVQQWAEQRIWRRIWQRLTARITERVHQHTRRRQRPLPLLCLRIDARRSRQRPSRPVGHCRLDEAQGRARTPRRMHFISQLLPRVASVRGLLRRNGHSAPALLLAKTPRVHVHAAVPARRRRGTNHKCGCCALARGTATRAACAATATATATRARQRQH